MFTVEASGSDRIIDQLTDLTPSLQAALALKAAELAQQLKAHVTDDKLSGQVLQVKSGALRASIGAAVDIDDGVVTARVFSAGDLKYAAIQELGGHTPAHYIVPNKTKALAFMAGGKTVFATLVHHPGSQIPARAYMRSALADMAGEITDKLKRTVVEHIAGRIA